jgi:type I restriction enzyme S subunit
MVKTPEDKAREVIDKMLEQAGWHVCDLKDANIRIQQKIVEEVERRLSVAEEIETNLKRAEHLRQAILKKAFSGRLVERIVHR